MKAIHKHILIMLAGFAATCIPLMASAEMLEQGRWAVMAFGGIYKPKPHGVDNGGVFGIRGGHALTDRVAVSGSLTHSDLGHGDQTMVDANGAYGFRPGKRFSFVVTGGIGVAFIDNAGENDTFTMNVGFGPAIGLNERLAIRLLNRFRWFQNRNSDQVDQEITLGLVVKLGNK